MSSNIDTAIPPFGNPTTAGVRNNFSAAKEEIESLQTAKVIRIQHFNDSLKVFQQITASNTPQVIDFNSQLFNNGGIYTFDEANNEIEFSESGWYSASISFHVERQAAGGGAADFYIHSELKEPSGDWTDFPGSSRIITMDGASANQKDFHTIAFISQIVTPGTRIRWQQMTTDHTKTIGICTYPSPMAHVPSAAGISFSVQKISEEL